MKRNVCQEILHSAGLGGWDKNFPTSGEPATPHGPMPKAFGEFRMIKGDSHENFVKIKQQIAVGKMSSMKRECKCATLRFRLS